eukprot:g2577.t1
MTLAGSSRSPSSTLPVEPSGVSSSGVSPPPPLNAPGGVPGPSVPAATAAVARGDVEKGLSIFLQCMSRRRLKLAAEAAAVAAAAAAAAAAAGRGEGQGVKEAAVPTQGGVPACNMFLRALGDARRIDDCVVAYEAMVACELRPTIVTFSTLISRAGACRRVRVAERFFREMLEAGITPDVQAINSLINAFSKAGSPDQALKAFDEMSRYGVTPSVITFNSLIDACGRAGDVDRARHVFSRLAQAGLRANDRTFSALIHSHAVQGQVDEAFSWLREMRAQGLEPNRVTYSTLINACGRAGQLARAFQTLDEMVSAGIEPNVITWTTLIDACGKGKELEWSFRLFKEMRERGTVPNGVTCSALLDACLKADELDLAFAVLEHMLDVGIEPTEVTYTSLLTQCARLGQADRAGVVLDELNKKRPSPGNSSSSSSSSSTKTNGGGGVAATAAADPTGGWEAASTRSKGRHDEPPSRLEGMAATLSSAPVARLSAPSNTEAVRDTPAADVAGGGGIATAESGGKEAGEAWRMDRKLENDLLKLFGQADQVDAAFKVLEGMVERRDSPDGETWLLLLNAVDTAGALDKAVELMERSRAEGHGSEINELTYSALLGACGRAKKLARAFRIVQGMRETGVKPTEGTYLALMEVCRHSRDSKAAVEVFEAMKTQGVRPGVRSYTSLLKVISEENTLRTRALQRTRMLETRRSSPSTAAAASALAATANTSAPPSPVARALASSTSGSSASDNPEQEQGIEGEAQLSPAGEPVVSEAAGVAGASGFAAADVSVIAAWEASGRPAPASAAASAAAAAGGAGGSGSGGSEATRQSSPPPAATAEAAAAAASESNANPALDNLFRVFLVFQEMRSRGVRPDLRAYNALVNTCADLGEFDRALGVVRLMVDDEEGGGLQPDAVTYTSLIKAAARASPPRVKEAEEIFATMQQRTNHFSTFARPTEVTYAHLMRASVMAGDFARALEVWRQQLSAGVAPGSRSTRAALSACEGAGDVDTALEVYGLMREAGIRPNSRSLLELVNLCRANGLEGVAARIMRQRSKMAATTSRRNANVSRRYGSRHETDGRSSSGNNGGSSSSGSSSGNNSHGKGRVSTFTRKNAGRPR